jgi:hypothetical protein
MAFKDDNDDWKTYVGGYLYDGDWVSGYLRDLDWMEVPGSGFADYNKAFLFTSWQKNYDGVSGSGSFTGNLEVGFTDGYSGTTVSGPASPVAAYSPSEGMISGGEAQVVPIPGAIWLLASGLFGVAGFRRRKK